MKTAPSLLSLCIKSAAASIPHGCEYVQDVVELPFDLLDALAMELSPLALQTLHEMARDNYSDEIRVSDNNQRKRGRYEIFDIAWKELYRKRWPENIKNIDQINNGSNLDNKWHSLYCQSHLQECFDGAAEKALVPSFIGSISELTLSDKIMDIIGYTPNMNNAFTKLRYHCKRFGPFSKCLRLQSVLCSEEMAELMKGAKLETLIFTRIIFQNQVDGVCMLLNIHKETLKELQFIHSQIQPDSLNKIYNSLIIHNSNNNNEEFYHKIRILKFKSSRFYENKSKGLISFISSGRDLKSVHFCDTKLQQSSAQIILDTIFNSSCELTTLEISDNYIGAWLSNLRRKYNNFTSFLPHEAISLNTISSLNLKGNYLEACDALDLNYLLQKMPNLINLDLSDNTFTDEGLRYLIPYLKWAFEKEKPILSLNISNCCLTNKGINELIENCIDLIKEPLNFLSLADNHLGSMVAENLAKLMGESYVKELNIEEICLEKLGFKTLELFLPPLVSLSSLNISKNRGKKWAANFISKLILRAPNLVSIDSRSNIMHSDSLNVIYNSLKKLSRRNLERVDLTYNPKLCKSELKSEIMKFEHRGHPIIIFPAPGFNEQDYIFDDDL